MKRLIIRKLAPETWVVFHWHGLPLFHGASHVETIAYFNTIGKAKR